MDKNNWMFINTEHQVLAYAELVSKYQEQRALLRRRWHEAGSVEEVQDLRQQMKKVSERFAQAVNMLKDGTYQLIIGR